MSEKPNNWTFEKLLELFGFLAFADSCRSIFWRTDGEWGPITFFVNCNDLFFWGYADAEEVSPGEISDLKQAYEDCNAICKDTGDWLELYCARKREMRPQGACYSGISEELWSLFDACGPEREIGIGNPKKPQSKIHERLAERD